MAFRLFSWLTGNAGKKPPASPTRPQSSSIQKRVEVIRSSGLPLQEQESALRRLKDETVDMDESLFLQANADFVADIMANRNVEGAALERLHQPDKAIELYEANLRDHFKSSYPYERLRILYSASGKYTHVKRVCQAFIEHGRSDEAEKAKYREWLSENGRQ